MEDLKKTFSKNLISLRKSIGYTQSDLADKLNYSDKAVSKWERGEAIPDIYMLKQMADFFGITIDTLISEHKKDEIIETDIEKLENKKIARRNHYIIAFVSVFGIWLAALIVFIGLQTKSISWAWLSFIVALPVSFLVTFILSCIWGHKVMRLILLSLFIWTLLLLICLITNIWLLILIGVPAQIITILSFLIKTK